MKEFHVFALFDVANAFRVTGIGCMAIDRHQMMTIYDKWL